MSRGQLFDIIYVLVLLVMISFLKSNLFLLSTTRKTLWTRVLQINITCQNTQNNLVRLDWLAMKYSFENFIGHITKNIKKMILKNSNNLSMHVISHLEI